MTDAFRMNKRLVSEHDQFVAHITEAEWTAEKRAQYLKDHPENFAGPDGSFPIQDASDVSDAAGLYGKAGNPDAVKSKIKSIARRLKLTSGLPKEWQEADDPDGLPDVYGANGAYGKPDDQGTWAQGV